jgi:hypothetical protein
LDIQHFKGFQVLLRIKSTLATTTFVFYYLAQAFIPRSRMNDRMNRRQGNMQKSPSWVLAPDHQMILALDWEIIEYIYDTNKKIKGI